MNIYAVAAFSTMLGILIMYLYCNKTMVKRVNFAVLETEKNQQVLKAQELSQSVLALQVKIEGQQNELVAKDIRISELNTLNQGMQSNMEQHKKDIQEMQEQFKLQFQNISNELLTKQTGLFGEQSTKAIGALLEPFKSEIKTINDSIQKETQSKGTLEGAIKQVVESNAKISVQAENFAKALKGDNKVQGNWGEIMLEKILEESGLRKGVDYVPQAQDMGLKNEANRTVKPDVVVNLPENKHIIIDSKVSLTDYERYVSTENDDERTLYLKGFLSSIKNHVKNLSDKSYHDIGKVNTPDFVLMFMCIEGAYTLAIQQDPEIHSYAWDRKIVIVCPSTLYTTLRTINSVWRLELQNRNALEIAKKGGALYDKLVGFVEDLTKVGSQLNTVTNTYNSAMNKISTGKDTLLSKAEKLKKLGIKHNKQLPSDLLDSDDTDVEEAGELSGD